MECQAVLYSTIFNCDNYPEACLTDLELRPQEFNLLMQVTPN